MMSITFVVLLFCLTLVACISVNRIETSSQPQKGDVLHCHCNLPECITTGYMCKSQNLGCFSDIDANMSVDRATHGCLDLLPKERSSECGNIPGPQHPSLPVTPSLLLCCQQDMCNHVDSPETRHKYNQTIFAVAAVIAGNAEKTERANYDREQQELWFKAATIAVPICGGLILLVLIILAVKILRSDSFDEAVLAAKLRRKHGFPAMNGPGLVEPSRQVNFEKKLPLLFHQNDTGTLRIAPEPPVLEKNLANAKLNTNTLTDFEKRSDPSSCNLFHGVTSPLLLSGRPDKLDYKRALTKWPEPL